MSSTLKTSSSFFVPHNNQPGRGTRQKGTGQNSFIPFDNIPATKLKSLLLMINRSADTRWWNVEKTLSFKWKESCIFFSSLAVHVPSKSWKSSTTPSEYTCTSKKKFSNVFKQCKYRRKMLVGDQSDNVAVFGIVADNVAPSYVYSHGDCGQRWCCGCSRLKHQRGFVAKKISMSQWLDNW